MADTVMSRHINRTGKKAEIGEWLSVFKIEVTSSSFALYENGLQQVEVTLSVAPVPDVVITPEQLESLTIVYLKPDGDYEALPEKDPAKPVEWFFSKERDKRFEYYTGSTLASPAPLVNRLFGCLTTRLTAASGWLKGFFFPASSVAEISKAFYVSTLDTGGTLKTLHARIVMSDDAVFVSEDANESEIELTSIVRPNYFYPEDYTWANTWSEGDASYAVFIQEWSLSAKQAPFSCAEQNRLNIDGMIRWERNAVGESAASNVGVGYPGIKTVYYNPEIDVGSDFASRRHTTIRSSNDRQVVVVLQGDNRIPFYMEGLEHSGPSRVLAYDIDGNTHNLEFSFGIEGSPFEQRTTLRVNATSPAKRSDTSAAVYAGALSK